MTRDGRPGREPESASFETARVRPRRGTQPIFILGFLVLVGAFVAVGVGGQAGAGSTLPPVAIHSPAPVATVTPSPKQPSMPIRTPAAPGDEVPTYVSGPGEIELLARRLPSSVFIHGDVFVPRVTWVFVSLRDDAGDVAGWASVSVPGAAGPARDEGPTLRFDVEVSIPERFDGLLWLDANVYDADGVLVGNVRLEIPPV